MSAYVKRFLCIPVVFFMAFSLSGCNEDSASERLAKKQLESISDAEKKKKEGTAAIQNNTVNPFSFEKKAPTKE